MQAADQACLLDVRPIDVHEVQNRTEYFLRCTDSVAQFGSHCSQPPFPTFSYILPLDAIKRPGLWLRGLSSRFSHVIGLDQSQKLLEKALDILRDFEGDSVVVQLPKLQIHQIQFEQLLC